MGLTRSLRWVLGDGLVCAMAPWEQRLHPAISSSRDLGSWGNFVAAQSQVNQSGTGHFALLWAQLCQGTGVTVVVGDGRYQHNEH